MLWKQKASAGRLLLQFKGITELLKFLKDFLHGPDIKLSVSHLTQLFPHFLVSKKRLYISRKVFLGKLAVAKQIVGTNNSKP